MSAPCTDHELRQTRREFLTSLASGGLGLLALASLLARRGPARPPRPTRPSGRRPARARGRRTSPRRPSAASSSSWTAARRSSTCSIPSPSWPSSAASSFPSRCSKNVRFAFIKKDATLRASPRKFQPARRSAAWSCPTCCRTLATCADDLCLIRSLHTDQFNHHPAQLMMQCGRGELGLPVMGAG